MSITLIFYLVAGIILLCIGLINILYEAKAFAVQKRLGVMLPKEVIVIMEINKYLPFAGVVLLIISFVLSASGL